MEELKPIRKAGPLTSRGCAAWLAITVGYALVIASIARMFNGKPISYMRIRGAIALVLVVFSIVTTYRDVKSRRRYHLTVLLLIFAIICATADGWVLVTAPLWATVLMALKKRWFGPVAW